ncbi:MAG: orotate phosphoribosyltransferase [Candidatus Odinarchaeia archaeon]
MKKWQIELIEFLALKKGLLFGNFKLKSGRVSPYFFNLTQTIQDGEGVKKIAEFYVKGIEEFMGGFNFDFIMGPAYKAIPLSAAIALVLYSHKGMNLRWGYDRKEVKAYGVSSEKLFVGNIKQGDRLLIVDDVATTGMTKINLINKLSEAFKDFNLKFEAVLILLDRQEKDAEGNYVGDVLKNLGVKLYSLLKVREVFEYLKENKISGRLLINEDDYNAFLKYQKEYGV